MSKDLVSDIAHMHQKYRVHDWIYNNPEKMPELLKLRMMMLNEEYSETMKAYLSGDAEEVVDGLIDIIVIALGTLDLTGVDAGRAWDVVHKANMDKQVGVKPGRPNPLGLPDLIKPDGWTAPGHTDNLGNLPTILGGS